MTRDMISVQLVGDDEAGTAEPDHGHWHMRSGHHDAATCARVT